ncbi:MAG: alanine--glyoxylate aminotransferase family protein [Candidatus Aminicenantes bacterium]|nr:alanine--glyoxylate aminotransferase family protein [Candidatus Aminicenantes bacterium]
MNRHIKLFIPGPGDVDADVLAAAARPILRHYGPEWMGVYNELQTLLKQVFKTKNDMFIVPGPASALHDMAIGSLLTSGQKIIVGHNGFFGERLVAIAEAYGLTVVPFAAPLGRPLDPDELRRLVAANPDARVVALVHHETATTVVNPLRALAEAAREAGKVIVVDAVSSLGGIELPVDEWGIDICVTASNKCLEALPGVGFMSVGPRAWELVDGHPGVGHGWYLSLKTWRQYAREWGAWHPTPVTVPVNILMGVLAKLRRIVAGGLEEHLARYARASRAVRTGLRNAGFEMYVPDEHAAPVVTAVKARPEFTVAELSQWLEKERGLAIGGALGELAGKIFRVGHLGQAATREYLLDFLVAVEEFLRHKNIRVPPGATLAGFEASD